MTSSAEPSLNKAYDIIKMFYYFADFLDFPKYGITQSVYNY